MEEAAHMSEEMFTKVIIPLLAMAKTSLLAISSVTDSNNFYSTMLLAEDASGEPFFTKIEIRLCCPRPSCQDSPNNCPHESAKLPPWQSMEKHDRIKELLKDQIHVFEQEMMGVIVDEARKCFPQEVVDQIYLDPTASTNLHARSAIKYVLVTADPSQYGK